MISLLSKKTIVIFSLKVFLNCYNLVLEGFGGVPPIRPLETLHNALSLKQLDTFLEKMTTVTLFKTPASSPPKYPSTPLPTPAQTPHNSLPDKSGPLSSKLQAEENEQELADKDAEFI